MTIKTAQGSRRPTAKLVPFLVSALLLAACGGGGDKELHTDVYKATSQASDPAATPAAQSVMKYLAALSNDTIPGVLAGQNTGHGDQILNLTGTVGYAPLIDELERSNVPEEGLAKSRRELAEILTEIEALKKQDRELLSALLALDDEHSDRFELWEDQVAARAAAKSKP